MQLRLKYFESTFGADLFIIKIRLVQLVSMSLPTAHPRTRLFITHGGLGGVQEAIFNAVPMLGLPIVNDQFSIMAKVSNKGAGLTLEWDDINDEYLKKALDTVLNDPR